MVPKYSILPPLSPNSCSQANGKIMEQAKCDCLPDIDLKATPMSRHNCIKNKFVPRKAAENLVKLKSKRQLSIPVMNMKVPLPYIGVPYPFFNRQNTFDTSSIPGYITQGYLPTIANNILPQSEPRNIIYPLPIPSMGANSLPNQYSPVYVPLEDVRDYKQPIFTNPNPNLVLARNNAGHIEYLSPSNEGQQVVWLINRNDAVNSLSLQNNQVGSKNAVTEMPVVSTCSITSLPVKKTWKLRNIDVPESHLPTENNSSILDDNAEIEDVPGIPLHTNLYCSSMSQKYELTKKLSEAKTPAEMLSLIGRPKVKLVSDYDVRNVNFIEDDQSGGQDELSGDQSENDRYSAKFASTDSSHISTLNNTKNQTCTNNGSIETSFISRPDFSFVNAMPEIIISDQGVSSSFKESCNNLPPECSPSLDSIVEKLVPISAQLGEEGGVLINGMQSSSTNGKSGCPIKRTAKKTLATVENGRDILTNKSQKLHHTFAFNNTTRNENKYVKVIKSLGSEIVSHLVELENDNAMSSLGQNLMVKEVGWLKHLTEKLQGCLTQKPKVLGIQNKAGVSQRDGIVRKHVAITPNAGLMLATLNREFKNKTAEEKLCLLKQLGNHHNNEDTVQRPISVAELHCLNQTSQALNCASKSYPLSMGIADLNLAPNVLPTGMPLLIEKVMTTKVPAQRFTNEIVSSNMLDSSRSLVSLYTNSPSGPLSRETVIQSVQQIPQLDSPSGVNNLDGVSIVVPDNPNILKSYRNVKTMNPEKEYSRNSLNGHNFAALGQSSADLETGHDPQFIDISAHNGLAPLQYVILNPAYPNKEVSSITKAALSGLTRQDTKLMYGVATPPKETVAATTTTTTTMPKLSNAQEPATIKDAASWQSPIIVLPLKGNLLLPLRSNISLEPNSWDMNRLKRLSKTAMPPSIIVKRLTPFSAENRYFHPQTDILPGEKVVHHLMEQFRIRKNHTVPAPGSCFNEANDKPKSSWGKSFREKDREIIRPTCKKCNSSSTSFMFKNKESALDEDIYPNYSSNALSVLSADVSNYKKYATNREQETIKAMKNNVVDCVGGSGEFGKHVLFSNERRKDKRSTNLSASDGADRNNIYVKNGLVKFGTEDEKIKRVLDIMADINNYFVSCNDKLVSLASKSKTFRADNLLDKYNSENCMKQRISSIKTNLTNSSNINKYLNKNINKGNCLQSTITSDCGQNMSSIKNDMNDSNIINKKCTNWYNNDDCIQTAIVSEHKRNNLSINSDINNSNNSNTENYDSVISNDNCLDPTIASKMKDALNSSFSKGKAINFTFMPNFKLLEEELDKLTTFLEILHNEKRRVLSSSGFNKHSHVNNTLPYVDSKPRMLNKRPLNHIEPSNLTGTVTDANRIPDVVKITNELSKLISLLELKKKINKTWRQENQNDLTSIVQDEKNRLNDKYSKLFTVSNQTDTNPNFKENSLETQLKQETNVSYSDCNKRGKIGVVSDGDIENSELMFFLSDELSHFKEKVLNLVPYPDILNVVDALLTKMPHSQRLESEHTILPDDELDDATSYACTTVPLLSTMEFKVDQDAYTSASLQSIELKADQYANTTAPLLCTTEFNAYQYAYKSAPLLSTIEFKADQYNYTSMPLLSISENKTIQSSVPNIWNGYVYPDFNKIFSTVYPVQVKKFENMSLSSCPNCSNTKTFDNKSTDAGQCKDMKVSVPFNIIVQKVPQNRIKQLNGQCPQVSSRASTEVDPSEIIVKYKKFNRGPIDKLEDDVKVKKISSSMSKHEHIIDNHPTGCKQKMYPFRAGSSLRPLLEELFDTAPLETHYDQQIILPDRIATYSKEKSVFGKS